MPNVDNNVCKLCHYVINDSVQLFMSCRQQVMLCFPVFILYSVISFFILTSFLLVQKQLYDTMPYALQYGVYVNMFMVLLMADHIYSLYGIIS